jgi:ribosomal protein L14E/L6E/L27E
MVKQYGKIKMKDGKFAVIVEILEPQKAYIADVELSEGEFTTETISHSDIASLIVEVEQPLAELA